MSAIVQVGNVQATRANGVHAAIRRLTSHLQLDGQEVEVWHLSRRVREVAERDDGGIRVVDLPVRGPAGRLGAYVQVPTAETAKWLRGRARRVSVLHLHSVFQSDHVWAARLGVPYVLSPHGGYYDESFRGPGGAVKKLGLMAHERQLLQEARYVQVLSTAEQDRVRALAPRARPLPLPFPVDLEPVGANTGSYQADGPVLFLGRLDIRHKGLDLLLDAVSRARHALAGRHVLLVGPSSGDSARRLVQRTRKLAIGDLVEVLPPVQDRAEVRRLLFRASLFVHPSRWEGLPTAVLEAMAARLPVLVTGETNLGDLVRRAGCGQVAESSAFSIETVLRSLLQTPAADRAAMGRRGEDAVRDAFDWELLRPGYRALYGTA